LHLGPWVHNHTLGFYKSALAGGGEFACGDLRLGVVNMLHRGAIGLTADRMEVVIWPEVLPASGDGKVVAALPRRLGFRRTAVKCG
jgi:hypothetical protein